VSIRPLLVVDGDSFAHRAFHALPRSMRRADGRPGNALEGFMSMLLRLWQSERPRAVVVGWDSIGHPTYRNELLPGYQAGREFDPELLEQLDLLPALVTSTGMVAAKAAGYEADDFLAAAVAQEERRGGRAVVATSDRDMFQLASASTTILVPTRGVSEMVRVGPVEVRERYDVEPEQVPDFIALRGDPSDRIPGARGVGAKTAASLLREHRSLEALLAAGRFAAEAPALRDYLRIATVDPTAPVPELEDHEPDWRAGAEAARELGLTRLAKRLDEAAEAEA
jgi:DNA polymerase-1